ncbi:MAG: peptidase T [Eubacteriales bacterium]|nr:peptidase T [Eubacteriales bacterium]MDD3881641.1 peptidase T [Eubacteriales bacterium]MDD4512300.1 peptidase T [Eubacteriales bacterium]
MKVSERFLKYANIDTNSSEDTHVTPSTPSQLPFARALADEMKAIGLTDVTVSAEGYVYGTLPETAEGDTIALISHMDTSPAMPASPLKARTVRYNGGDVTLNAEKNIVMSAKDFPSLLTHIGEDIIITDGTTLLGADDKAGIAEILTLCERLLTDKSIKHPRVRVAFTPDEEIGEGADHFDLPLLGAKYGYTVDGGDLGEIEYENFNAAAAAITVHGVNIHPGSAKNKMVNAALLAMEFASMLPPAETPAHTEGYEGFYHLCSMEGNEEKATLKYIIRDHDMDKFNARKAYMEKAVKYLAEKYGEGVFELSLRDSYLNMRGIIEKHMDVVERAVKAMEKCQVKPLIQPIRGGTDGARLSFMGLPCPNLSTGGHNFHGRYEYISVQSMEKMVDVLEALVSL